MKTKNAKILVDFNYNLSKLKVHMFFLLTENPKKSSNY